MRIPLEPPFFSKRGRAAIATRCKRVVPPGYEGASPSASTILHPTRRKRRTVLVRQTAGRTSLWMLHFFAGVAQQERRNVENVESAGATPAVGTNFSASGGVNTRESQKLVGESPCRCESCLADQV